MKGQTACTQLESTCLNLFTEAHTFFRILCQQAGNQSLRYLIDQGDSLFQILRSLDNGHRTESLLLYDGRIGSDISDERGLVPAIFVPSCRSSATTQQSCTVMFHCIVDGIIDTLQVPLGDERWQLQACGCPGQLTFKVICYGVFDDKAADGCAALSCEAEGRSGQVVDLAIQISIGQYDDGIIAAQLRL